MSIVNGTIRRIDAQLEKLQLQILGTRVVNSDVSSTEQESAHVASDREAVMQGVLRALSATSDSQPVLRADRLVRLLQKIHSTQQEPADTAPTLTNTFEADLLWLIAAKATLHSLGLVMRSLIDQTIGISNEIWYWDETLASFRSTCLYALQTMPLRVWSGMNEVKDVWKSYRQTPRRNVSLSALWQHFYEVILRTSDPQLARSAAARMISPLTLYKSEVRLQRKALVEAKHIQASSIGVLLEECLSLEDLEDVSDAGSQNVRREEWRAMIAKSVILIDTILQRATRESQSQRFEDSVFASIESEANALQVQTERETTTNQPQLVIGRLIQLLDTHLPNHNCMTAALIRQHGRPPWAVRYWLPLSVALLSASTCVSIISNRRVEIMRGLVDIGTTTVDFWRNWVVDPIRKLIGTIRHDEKSEVAIMSKKSLEADRASLERMVVDFVTDRPDAQHDRSHFDSQIIAQKVREGDLTPVLTAYERDLRKPFMGTVRGDLVRALLIQIQKTKVDVEVAISGIDALLKSQELVFGFVGLTPGLLVSFAGFRWLWNLSHNRRGMRAGARKDDLRRALRNVDRTLTNSSPTANGLLSSRDHGLLICETQLLAQKAENLLGGINRRDFKEDIAELLDVKRGIEIQFRVLQRIVWTYSKELRL